MAKYSAAHYNLVLAQMLRSPAFALSACERLEGNHFTSRDVGGTVAQAVLFKIIKDYVQEHETVPDLATMRVHFTDYLLRYFPDSTQWRPLIDQYKMVVALAKVADERGEAGARKLLTYVTEVAIYKPAVLQELDQAKATNSFSGLGERLQQLDVAQSMSAGGQSFDNILDVNMDVSGERLQTHIPFLDSRLGGGRGPSRGCGMAIIAPQGVGKTTLGIGMCVGQALCGEHALLVLAEEGFSQSIKNKIIGCALGVNYTLFERQTVEEVLAAQGPSFSRELAVKKLMNIKKYFHILDLTQRGGGMEAVAAEVASLTARGINLTYTYVDWAGIIASADELVTSGKKTAEAKLREISYAVAHLGSQTNSVVAIAQQMAGKNVERGPFHHNDHYCAADCRGFTAPFKYVIIINPTDPNTGLNIMTIAKSRDDEKPKPFPVRLRGEMSTFIDVSQDWEMTKRGVRSLNAGKASRGIASVVGA